MTLVLADTSIWVRYLRHGPTDPWGSRLDEALESGRLLICGPVVAELLTGTGAADRDRLAATLRAIDWVDLGRREWLAAGELAAKLRGAGDTVPLTDASIAVAAISGDAELLTADADFERIAEVDPRLRIHLLKP